jgi:hypothetical protein
MTINTEAWAAWHPKHGFAIPYHEGAIVFDNIDDAVRQVKNLNQDDRTNNRNGWRAVRVQINKLGSSNA